MFKTKKLISLPIVCLMFLGCFSVKQTTVKGIAFKKPVATKGATVAKPRAVESVKGNAGDVYLSELKINNKNFAKTEFIIISNKSVTIETSQSDYEKATSYVSFKVYPKNDSLCDKNYRGAFLAEKTVTIQPFVMGKYEVTQELYTAVMGKNPSYFPNKPYPNEEQKYRPVENMTWVEAIVFCNELTKKTMGENECVYKTSKRIYNAEDAKNKALVLIDFTKKGYRLPKKEEWEFAARGGNPDSEVWNYALPGLNAVKLKNSGPTGDDSNLLKLAWFVDNCSDKTHQVGLKQPSTLGLYDMAGNVGELCSDFDKLANGKMLQAMLRGGWYTSDSSYCTVSRADYTSCTFVSIQYGGCGIRLVRSL